MAYLVPSLARLFDELNATWPNRDHRTDGWIGDSNHCPGSSDHCADSVGRVHAIDVDKDGIDPGLVISRLSLYPDVIRYINYNYYQYHKNNGYEPKKLGGSDPHTTHLHVSIEHTDTARGYVGGYGILPGTGAGGVFVPDLQIRPQEDWDHSQYVHAAADIFGTVANLSQDYASAASYLRI